MTPVSATRAPLLTGADAARALDVAEQVLARAVALLDRSTVLQPESVGAYGGAVLVADALARAGRGREGAVRELLKQALVFAPDRLGLYGGAAGLLVVLDAVDPERASLAAVRARLRAAVAASIRDAAPPDVQNYRTYDLVTGVAGRAIALRGDAPDVLPALRAYAERFADDVDASLANHDPQRPVNLGVAHGVPGLLAALNFAQPDDRALGRRYTELLLRTSQHVDGAARWNAVWRPGEVPSVRRAWCYQTVGVAAVLYDRARLDGDDALRALAAGALRAVLDERHDGEQIWDAALCHGRSGVASIAWHVAGDDVLAEHAARLARRVLGEFDESKPLGYSTFNLREQRVEHRADFLDAALGIAQFLTDAASGQDRRWLPLFGLLPG